MVRISIKRWVGNFVTRYSITEGALRGVALGTSVRYYDGKPPRGGGGRRRADFARHHHGRHADRESLHQLPPENRPHHVAGADERNNVFNKITDQGAQYRYPRYTEPRQFIYTLSAQF